MREDGVVPRARLSLLLVIAAVLSAGCGAADLRDSETAVDAQAAVEEAETTVVEAAPATEVASPSADNGAAWAAVDAAAQEFAGQYDAATQSVALCETAAAAGEDFTQCLGNSFTAVADAEDRMIARMTSALEQADGGCRAAIESMRGAAAAMAAEHRSAVGVADLTSMETHQLEMGAAATAYADTAIAAGAACAS